MFLVLSTAVIFPENCNLQRKLKMEQYYGSVICIKVLNGDIAKNTSCCYFVLNMYYLKEITFLLEQESTGKAQMKHWQLIIVDYLLCDELIKIVNFGKLKNNDIQILQL